MILEAEPNLRVDTTVVSGVAATKTSEAARCRRRLTEERRAEVADRIAQVRVIKNIVEVERERQIVATAATTRSAKATAAWSTTKTSATAAAAAARTTATGAAWTTARAAAHYRVALSITLWILPILTILLRIRATALRAETPRFADAHVDGD